MTKFDIATPDRTETRKVKGKKTTVHLLEAPTSCHGSWTFSETLGFVNQPALTASDGLPCVKG